MRINAFPGESYSGAGPDTNFIIILSEGADELENITFSF